MFHSKPDFGVVIVLQNQLGVEKHIVDTAQDLRGIALGDRGAFGRGEDVSLGVVPAQVRDEAAVGEDHQGGTLGEHVPAHQQAGVVLQAEEI